jgi:hypothetical protein
MSYLPNDYSVLIMLLRKKVRGGCSFLIVQKFKFFKIFS